MGIDRTGPIGPLHPASGTPAPRSRATDRAAAPPASSAPAPREDRIDLSDEARALQGTTPTDREARVDELRAQVRFGSYRVDADEVAQRMVERGDA